MNRVVTCAAVLCMAYGMSGGADNVAVVRPGGHLPAGLTAPAGTATHYTGKLLPKPKEVLGEWREYPLSAGRIEIRICQDAHGAVALGASLLADRVHSLSKQAPSDEAGPQIVVHLGRLQDSVIRQASETLGVDLSGIVVHPEGYVIRCVMGDDKTLNIIAAGQDHRGAFYAASSLLQMTGVVNGRMTATSGL